MGGLGLSIGLKHKGRKAGDQQALLGETWDLFERWVRRNATKGGRPGPYRLVTADYLGQCREDACCTKDGLTFAFMDGSGCSGLSSQAAYHWFEVLRSRFRPQLAALARAHGYELAGSFPSVEKLLARGPTYPLVLVDKNGFRKRDTLCGVAIQDGEVTLFSDEGVAVPDVARLPVAAQKRLKEIATTRRCECAICERARTRALRR